MDNNYRRIIEEEVKVIDFKEGSILRSLAEHDIKSALEFSSKYGGSRVYILEYDTVTRAARNRLFEKEMANG